PWLTAVLDAGYEKVGSVWAGLDAEFRALWLQQHTTIFDASFEEEPRDDDETPFLATPDRFFTIGLLGDEQTQRITQALIEDLYRADADLARHTIMSARSEPAAELEEMSYRWRSGRLADIGYVDFYDALDLFKPLELNEVTIGEGSQDAMLDATPSALPAPIVEEMLGRNFLAAALARLDSGSEVERVQNSIMVLVNRVLAAGRAKPGQIEVMRRGALYATATMSLGLESVARGDVDRGAAGLRSIGALRLFRVGFTLTRRLGRLATVLTSRAGALASPGREVVAAIGAQRPLFPRAVENPPRPGLRPIETAGDIRLLAEVLARVTMVIALLERLGLDPAAIAAGPEPRPSLEHFVRTALCRHAISSTFTATPLSTTDVLKLRTTALVGGRWDAAVRISLHEEIASQLRHAGAAAAPAQVAGAVDGWLLEIAEILGDVREARIDPRFVDGVLLEPLLGD
ncbi:MAG: hypothetical protein KBG15_09755, partial [Kofleriaceae bacterium]|nr:hypothetical protein [Kofleriaceae bacterium]